MSQRPGIAYYGQSDHPLINILWTWGLYFALSKDINLDDSEITLKIKIGKSSEFGHCPSIAIAT